MDKNPTPQQLRAAAKRIALGQHPDQCGDVYPAAFERKSDSFTEVRLSGGSVFVSREAAEAEARR